MRHSPVKGYIRRTKRGRHCRVKPHVRKSYRAMPLRKGDFVRSKMTGSSGVVVSQNPFAVDYSYEDKEYRRKSNPLFWEKKG